MSGRGKTIVRGLGGVLLAVLVLSFGVAGAREFRGISLIPTPEALPEGVRRSAQFMPIDPVLVERAVRAVAKAWNTGQLDPLLGDRFENKSRLFDTIMEVVPRDAVLRVLSIQGVSTLDQYEQTREEGAVRVSTVSVIVLTQIEFSDPQTGFQRLDGTNEWTFRVTERLGGG